MKNSFQNCLLVAAAATLVLSCQKEDSGSVLQVGKVPVTLEATVDNALTRTVLGSDGLSVAWDGTESLAVFDGISATPNKFDATGAGATTSFIGEVSDGAENFIVVYPYQADAVVTEASTSTVQFDLPSVQFAVKDGFDPRAGLAAALTESLENGVSFKNQFALLKVTVDLDDVTSITVSSTNRYLAGSVKLKVSTNGGSNGNGSISKSVTLKKADNSALEQGVYYIAVRPSSESSPYSGFQMTVNKGMAVGTRSASASSALVVPRNTIKSIGKVSSLQYETSRYGAYMAGQSITIGNTTISKSTHGDATLLTAEDAVVALNKNSLEAGGVYFLKAVGTGSFSNTNNPTIKNSTYLLTDGDERVPVAMTNTINLADNGVLGLQGLSLSISGKTYFFAVNKNSNTSMDSFIMDDCSVAMSCASMISTNGSYKAYGIKHITITNSDFDVKVATNIVNVSSDVTGIADYLSFTFNNNTIYSSQEGNLATSIFAYGGSNGDQMVATIKNNLFYNAVNSGILKHNTLAAVTAEKNLAWMADGTTFYDSNNNPVNVKFFGMKSKEAISTVSVSDNIAFGTVGGEKKWTIADSTVNTGMEALTVLDTNPIAMADVATGTFTMAAGYESYGPQR